MPVSLIIDGYNLLGVRGKIGPGTSFDGDCLREILLQELSLYTQRKSYSITVVFDAWRARGGLEHGEHRSGVQVLYTRGGERADQVIQRMARKLGRDCVVVSSDLEIQYTAKDHGAFVLTSREFQEKLHAALQGRISASPRTPNSTQFVFGKDEGEPVRLPKPKKGNPRKLPKTLRKRHNQLRGF